MISELRVTDPDRACVPHWSKVPALSGRERIEFKPGLNILWGPNGSGKSTVLTALARMLHCEQGGHTTITHESMRQVFSRSRDGERLLDGVVPVHDGQCTLHFDPAHMVGLIGGLAGFDEDFFSEGALNAGFKGSSGESVMSRLNSTLLAVVERDKFPKTDWRVAADNSAKTKAIDAFLKGTLPKGQPTVLLDEPDRSLSMKIQAGLWANLAERHTTQTQVIAASHSPFALRLPGANYIDISSGYLSECEAVLDMFLVRMLRKTKK